LFSLAIKTGPLAGRRFELASQLVIGRVNADLQIDDPSVSRRHALFRPIAGVLDVEDLGSSNGTRVNGERITAATRLQPGDVVEIGGTIIEVGLESVPRGETALAGERPQAPPPQAAPAQVFMPPPKPTSLPPPPQEPALDLAAKADELRPVTALFADLVGSTAIGERLTPEEVKALIGECVSLMARAVEQFGGVVDAFMGDGIAAFFGLPVAHEDDPERAARAALHIVHVVGEYARDIETAWGIADFNVRVGLNSGQVAVGLVGGAKRQFVALGDTTNVAARLQGVAEPGSVVVGEATARRLSDHFVLEPLGEVSVKGRAEPVSVWRLRRPTRGLEAAAPTPLVGRDAELARLALVRDDLLSGRGQVLLLLGDAGIGKTRLLSELRTLAGDSVTWLEGSCVSYGTEFRLFPVVEALQSWLGLEEDAASLAVRTRLRIKLEPLLGPRLADNLPHLESLRLGIVGGAAAAPPESHSQDVRRACCAWIEALAEAGPIAFVFEDFQWADPWTCALAQDLLEIVHRTPLLLVASFRIAPQSEGWRFRVSVLAEHPHRAIELPLGPLSAADADRLLSLLAPEGLTDAASAEIVARAEGNPLYLEQLLRMVAETGELEHQRGWTLSPSVTKLVPAALESLLLSRIDNLTSSARQVAQMAAIVGRAFSYSVLGRVHPSELLEGDLNVLASAGVIRERRRYPELEYSFTHGLLREAALSTLTRSSRRELYGRVAAAFEELFADSLEEHLELLAHYYGRSDNLPKALEYLERAAEGAVRLKADYQAVELWRRASKAAVELGDVKAEARIAARLRERGE
jgi:class 3 adenylate cyclase